MPINLTSVMIGNGWYDPLIQYQAYYNYTVYPGNTYDYKPFNASVEAQMYNSLYGPGNCYDMTVMCNEMGWNDVCSYADAFCAAQVENVFDIVAERDEYDIRYLSPDPFPPTYYVDYLNTPKVQEAIGAYVNFTESNNAVSLAFANTGDDDREYGTVKAAKSIYDAGVTVVMYAGDADYNCNWLGGQVVAHHVNATGFENAGFTNISTSDGKVHGQVKQSGNFAFARIYESGHEVPFYQPLVSLEMFSRVIKGYDIEHGNVSVSASYITKGTEFSTYREGNSTIQLEVLGEDDDVVYDVDTALPVYENGTSANTGPGSSPPEKRVKRSEVAVEKSKKRRRAARWKPGKPNMAARNAAPVGRMAMPAW